MYFHGNKTTCRFPAQQCLNIHNENIHASEAVSDYRSRILCKHGNKCMFLARPGGCLYKHVENVEPQQNAWRQGSIGRHNTTVAPGGVQPVEASHQPNANTANMPTMNMNQMFMNLSKQMETISQKLQVLELKSLKDFPTLEASQQRR